MPSNPGFRNALRPEAIMPAACFLYFLFRYRSPAYFGMGLAVLGAFHFAYAKWERGPAESLGRPVLAFLGLALPALGLWQFLHLQDLGDLDHSVYACALWNFRHGNLHYQFHGVNILGVHSQYTSAFWIPVQFLAGEIGLKIGKALCLLATIALAVRRLRRDRTAAWAGAALLLSPSIASQFFFGFHPEFIAAPVLVLALEAYRDGRLGRFLACTAFLAYSKEVFTLAVGGILLLALAERRPLKWVLLPGALCCVQMAIYWYGVLPRFAPAGNPLGHYVPASTAVILSTWWRPQSFFYALHVLAPLLPLIAFFPKRYLLLPLPLMLFYAAFPDPMFLGMWTNYPFPLAILGFAGLVLAEERRIPDGRVLFSCAVISLLCYPLWREVISFPPPDASQARLVGRIRSRIPENASVVVNAPFTARLAARKEASSWGWRTLPLGHFGYAVVDTGFYPEWLVDREDLAAGLDTLEHSGEWVREFDENGVLLFRNRNGP